eukprot:7579362-Karenia_brevis.AAC.1
MSEFLDQQTTPYGPITTSIELDLEGQPYTWHVCNPFALIFALCKLNHQFCAMVHKAATQTTPNSLRFGFYADELTPGNNLRPDSGRKMQCLYFCLIDLPDHYRWRQHGWWLFGCLQSKTVNKLQNGMTELFRLAMH